VTSKSWANHGVERRALVWKEAKTGSFILLDGTRKADEGG